jgi:drug/metabolite transporter (DMT)-like permease
MRCKTGYHPYAIITILCWSLAYVLTRLTLRTFSAFALGFLRYSVAGVMLLTAALISRMKWPRRTDGLLFAAAGAAGFFLYMIAFNKGCETVPSSASSVILSAVPVITALLARIVCRETLRPLQWFSVFLEFLGVALLQGMAGFRSGNPGIYWLLLAALLLSVYNLLQRRLTKTYSALQTATFSIFAGTLMLAVFSPQAVREIRGAPPVQLIYVGLLGIFSSAVAYLSWSKALSIAEKTSSVSNYMFITPFLASLLGFLLAGEVPGWNTILGGAIILFGAVLFHFGGRIADRVHTYKKPVQ